MYEYLKDKEFLLKLDRLKIRKEYIKITVLSFDEKPIKEIQGIATDGTVNVDGASAMRRTCSLTILADNTNNDLMDIDNLISINKKIKIEKGIENLLTDYSKYGKIIWFKMGTYIISNASISYSTSGCTISLNGKDKMAMLDGSVGGTLPAIVDFAKSEVADNTGTLTDKLYYPTIFNIIYEAVNHYGGENPAKIYINDVPLTAKMKIKYTGATPIDFSNGYDKCIIRDSGDDAISENYPNRYTTGEYIGYYSTDFTYPGAATATELTLNAGDTVVTLLDKIKNTLGNYEYFYDLDGNFIFQEIKNYLNNSYTPITEFNNKYYYRAFTDNKYVYSFNDDDILTSIAVSPQMDKIKNEFGVWATVNGNTQPNIFYHLVIDSKPTFSLENDWKPLMDSFLTYFKSLEITDSNKTNITTLLQEYSNLYNITELPDWREWLYQKNFYNSLQGLDTDYYWPELSAFWRNVYNLNNENYINGWNPIVFNNPAALTYWLDFIDTNDNLMNYSVDKIGRRSLIKKEDNIGSIFDKDCPDVILINESNYTKEFSNCIFTNVADITMEIPIIPYDTSKTLSYDIKYNGEVIYEGIDYLSNKKIDIKLDDVNGLNIIIIKYYLNKESANISRQIIYYYNKNDANLKKYDLQGQKYCIFPSSYSDYFTEAPNLSTAYEVVREYLYQYLCYNIGINLNCITINYLEPNSLIYINNKKTKVNGNFIIKNFSIPLSMNGTMSINATEALTRI